LDIESSLTDVRSQVTQFETQYERTPNSVMLLAVSKKKPVTAIRSAIKAGQREFGENYVDEGVAKIQELNDPALSWHFIGAIQSRKTALIAEHFQWAHGVDRLKIARRLADQRPSHLPAATLCNHII